MHINHNGFVYSSFHYLNTSYVVYIKLQALHLRWACIMLLLLLLYCHMVFRGSLKYYTNQYKSAIEDLTTAVSLDRQCSLVYFNRALCQQALGNTEKVSNELPYSERFLRGKFFYKLAYHIRSIFDKQ